MNQTLSYHKGHPNPQLFRKNYQILDGEWDFMFDEENIGIYKKWFLDFPSDCLKIIVPYPYQTKKSGINEPNKKVDVIWYHKKINIEKSANVVSLVFLGVDYETDLFINGRLVYNHTGGYDIFKVNIASYLKDGENNITLRVTDRMNIDQLRGKQRWRKSSFECFYTETSGIWKSVYLEFLNNSNIKNFKFNSRIDEGYMLLEYTINHFNETRLKVDISFKGAEIYSKTFDVNNFYNRARIYLPKDEIHKWSVNEPNLYDVKFTLLKEDIVQDEILTYFGINDVSAKDGHVYLNNVDTYFKLILDQGYYPETFYTGSEEEYIKDISLMKEMGFNGCRKHEKIETPLFYYLCDTMGFLLWQELPSAHRYSYQVITSSKKEIFNQINDFYNCPSIVSYVIFNESWGINEIKTNKEEQNGSVTLYNFVKGIVPKGKFVISNDGWEHTKSDLITLHNYGETYESIFNLYQDSFNKIKNGQNAKANLDRDIFADDYQYNNEPLMLTEFGGIAYDKDSSKGWGYGNTVKNEDAYIDKLTGLMKAIYDIKEFRGYCLTQLSDVEIEVNGLVDFNRNLKVNIESIKKLNDMFN